MFQNFEAQTNPKQAQPRLQALRALMAEHNYDAFLVPHADEYQGEYLPPAAERLQWLTGFSGSAGFAIILRDQAVLFTDGRYRLQIRSQTDPALFSYEDSTQLPPAAWLKAYAQQQNRPLRIAFDPWLHSIKETEILRAALGRPSAAESLAGKTQQSALIAVEQNLVDAIWRGRPAAPQAPVSMQPPALTGRPAADKLAAIRAATADTQADACLLTDPTGLAWAFNLRGRDIAHTPVALGFALIPRQGKAVIFMEEEKFDAAARAALAPLAEIMPRPRMTEALQNYKKLMLDTRLGAEAIRLALAGAGHEIISAEDPTILPRACKTEAELSGARAAHRRDGLAMIRFLSWLDRQIAQRGAASLDEIQAAEALENFRRQTAEEQNSRLEDISFDTISGAGANGAVIHYRVSRATNRAFRERELYLIDSGGQYRDGTTDITRTIAIGAAGAANAEEKRCFTLVLKGMIALSAARFPQGARGRDLDILARQALWQNGMDYAHGTGHGVGSFLNVHEGPQSISRHGAQILLPGMIISNEPGYYRDGAFGIRIENLLAVRAAETPRGGDMPMLSFETLTLCPIDRRLIAPDLLSQAETDWLNAYHARIYAELAPSLNAEDKDWLRQATEKLPA